MSRVGDQSLFVEGLAGSGACIGDSGAPLLWRDRGALVVGGILSTGDDSCRGVDQYVRVDVCADWLESLSPERLADPALPIDCRALGSGRCFDGTATYCDGDRVVSESCTQGCSWDPRAGGFRCVGADEDAWEGVGERGRCDGGEFELCVDGRVEREGCSCQRECQMRYPFRQPRRGRVRRAGASSRAWTSQSRSGRAWSARNGRSESSGGVTAD